MGERIASSATNRQRGAEQVGCEAHHQPLVFTPERSAFRSRDMEAPCMCPLSEAVAVLNQALKQPQTPPGRPIDTEARGVFGSSNHQQWQGGLGRNRLSFV
ncbi:hypothetical protein J3459_006790 [Metarhizium acridum]|nr:hypothetical protein J3459_006790 [Metarhizium acridum]